MKMESNELILQNINVGIIFYDSDLKINWLNVKAEELINQFLENKDDSLKNNVSKTILETDLFTNAATTLETGIEQEDEIIVKDNDHKLIKSRLIKNGDNKIKGVIQTIYDITALKKLEKEKEKLNEQFIQAQKMESIGRLAGGISHDFRNILTAIIGLSDLILIEEYPKGEIKKPYVREIRKAAERATELIKQLLIFSRKESLQDQIINPNKLILNNKKMIQSLIGEDIILETNLEHDINKINIDKGQLIQILMNLMVNAHDAMPNGGKILIETKNIYLDNNYAKQHPEILPGDYVAIVVSDNGIGMDEQTKQKIFEPFFTTKKPDKGTGLGLSTVFGIVKHYNGFINVYSEINKGTTFKIYFPSTLKTPNKEHRKQNKRDIYGTENILLVEDDKDLRNMIEKMLRALGYSVTSPESGSDALSIIENNLNKIDLILTDVIMPGISGNDIVKCAQKINPKIKVLLISGYTENIIRNVHINSDIKLPFISKPFSAIDLGYKIREVLNS